MGSRDIGNREKKKQKKDTKKQVISSTLQEAPREVEVIRKGKKAKGRGEED